MFLRLLHNRYPGTPLPRKCLQLGATCFQPGTPSLGITHRGASRCWASCHPQDPLLPDSHSPVSSSLQPLCSTNQPSCTGLMKGCEAEPPVLLQLVPCSTSPPKPTPIHPQASFLDSYRGHSKAHSKVMLKLMLFCKEQKHLKANTQKRWEWGCSSNIHKAWYSLPTLQGACQVLHLLAPHPPQHPFSSPHPHIYCASCARQAFLQYSTDPTTNTQHKDSYCMMYQQKA